MMQTKTVHFERNGFVADVVVQEATTLAGMRRSRLGAQANRELKEEQVRDGVSVQDEDMWILRLVTYPDLIAPLVSIHINDKPDVPAFEEFIEFPEEFTLAWESAVYMLNPHWIRRRGEDESEKKE